MGTKKEVSSPSYLETIPLQVMPKIHDQQKNHVFAQSFVDVIANNLILN